MHTLASGIKRNYYGKGDVIVYRLNRDGSQPAGQSPVFGASVTMLVYGDSFWPTYTTGDNTDLVATDSMKNFIQRETLNFPGVGLEEFCRFLAAKFLATYPQTEGVQVDAVGLPYAPLPESKVAFTPAGGERAVSWVEMTQQGTVETRSGIHGFRLLRLGGSAFQGFVRDQYTTLPDISNRPLHMWLDLEWVYVRGAVPPVDSWGDVRRIVQQVFNNFESGSIQQVIYQVGTRVLEEIASIGEVRLEANNRTWDTVVEQGERQGVYTEARPPYGILGLTLRR